MTIIRKHSNKSKNNQNMRKMLIYHICKCYKIKKNYKYKSCSKVLSHKTAYYAQCPINNDFFTQQSKTTVTKCARERVNNKVCIAGVATVGRLLHRLTNSVGPYKAVVTRTLGQEGRRLDNSGTHLAPSANRNEFQIQKTVPLKACFAPCDRVLVKIL